MKRVGQRPHPVPALRGVTVLHLDESRRDAGVVVHLPPLPHRAQVDVRIVLAPGVRRLHPDVAQELADWLLSGALRVQVEGADPADALAHLAVAMEQPGAPTEPARDCWGLTAPERDALAQRYGHRTAAA